MKTVAWRMCLLVVKRGVVNEGLAFTRDFLVVVFFE